MNYMRRDVERVWANHVAAAAGEQWLQRFSCRAVIQRFLESVEVCRSIGEPAFGDRPAGRPAVGDPGCGGQDRVVCRRASRGPGSLFEGIGSSWPGGQDLLAEYRTHHGKRSWRCWPGTPGSEPRGGTRRPSQYLSRLPGPWPLTCVPTSISINRWESTTNLIRLTLQQFDRFLHAQAVASPQAVTSTLVEHWQVR